MASASNSKNGFLSKALQEIGLSTIWNSAADVKLLCLQRFIRLFAYGASTLILVAYLSLLDISDARTGLFMTLTLAGDVVISLLLTLVADQLGRRKVLALGAALMIGSGVLFGLASNYWILLAAAVFGVITPSGNEIGPFRAIEESTLAHLTSAEDRPTIFAWYSLIGTAGAALGLITCGWTTTRLSAIHGWHSIDAYRVVFFAYAAVGLVKLILSLMLSRQCEINQERESPETAPLLDGRKPKNKTFALLPQLSKESRTILIELCLLFAFDNFASGLAPLYVLPAILHSSNQIPFNQSPAHPHVAIIHILPYPNILSFPLPSTNFLTHYNTHLCTFFITLSILIADRSWTTNYFHRHFSLPQSTIGTLFFITSIISAISILAAASIARRFGNVKTMVFTHLPSSICLALIGIPSQLPVAITLLVIRACTQSMDTAPRSAFLAAVVLPNERTTVMGTVNVVKTLSQSLGPLVTGVLAGKNLFWVAFLVAGSLKATYDLGMLMLFAGHKAREEESVNVVEEGEESQSGR